MNQTLMDHVENNWNQLNELNQSTTYTLLTWVCDFNLKVYENHKQKYSPRSKNTHVTQTTNRQHHHRGVYQLDDEKDMQRENYPYVTNPYVMSLFQYGSLE